MQRFAKGDIIRFIDQDRDYKVICCDDSIAILAHTYTEGFDIITNAKQAVAKQAVCTDYSDIYAYSNDTSIYIADYDVLSSRG